MGSVGDGSASTGTRISPKNCSGRVCESYRCAREVSLEESTTGGRSLIPRSMPERQPDVEGFSSSIVTVVDTLGPAPPTHPRPQLTTIKRPRRGVYPSSKTIVNPFAYLHKRVYIEMEDRSWHVPSSSGSRSRTRRNEIQIKTARRCLRWTARSGIKRDSARTLIQNGRSKGRSLAGLKYSGICYQRRVWKKKLLE